MTETTEDRFLDGRLTVLQPKTGYRAATDPVLMAAAVPARRGQRLGHLRGGEPLERVASEHGGAVRLIDAGPRRLQTTAR